ncbi:CoA-binding protein [Caldisalinibacter kiritimatiensis]|uniref:CoA-binding protein n=1 Tax=Caldisalinibacter kiritimatiensis TaxID=1304284 RepID=R1AVK9_9FIRM|nr:CoA-binding protein [Caldisalinibacter kiritimatiensis]EOD00697.1 CoA-binding protein [Caldisalinibacter kiritimatiensis]
MDIIEKNKQEMMEKKVWAVLGVTQNKEKYGYKIWKKLKDNGYEVYAINPKYEEIEGEKCYDSLKDLPVKPEVVDFVVPPAISSKYVDEANELGIEYLWFQPGTVDGETIDKSEELGMKIVFHDCVLVALDE